MSAALRAAAISLGSSAAGSSAGGSGTVHIHSRSLSRSWVSSRMSVSAYSNSGDQKSASKGQTSMQIPQYMHSAKSIAKRSSTLRLRSRPPGAAGGTVSLWESM